MQCCLGRGLPAYQVASWSIQLFGYSRHGPKMAGVLCPFFWGGGAGSPSNTMSPGPSFTSVPSGILINPTVWVGCASFLGGELGPHLTQCGLGRGLPPYQVASWSIQPFGHNTQHHRQTGQTTVQHRRANYFTNDHPKIWGICTNDDWLLFLKFIR